MQTIRVEDIYNLHGTSAVSLPEDIDLEEVIAKFAKDPRIRGIFLVDSRQRFVGMVRSTDLRNWAQFRIRGGDAVGRAISVWDAYHLVSATKAKDLAHCYRQYFGVKKDDTLETALENMVEHETNILPVINGDGRIVGDLMISEVLLKVVEAGKRSGT